ncbi:MAG TPA: chemotaxis protein CheW [Candidatus Eisenbacteria bacterium]|nr:chemotaxis protein CheW [Candidatus Eisenbacteria bacterium]
MARLDPLHNLGSSAADGVQYLTFSLGAEEYGVEILKVQEIKGYTTITPIPSTPPYVKGVMNLRGTIVPVVDLRLRLGMPAAECTPFTVIIVMAVGTKVVGAIVDSVSDVVDVPRDDIQTTPHFGSGVDVRYIAGIAQTGEKLIVLLDVDAVLRSEELPAPLPAS